MAGKQVTELDALPSFTDNSLLPVHNGAGLKKGLLSQLVSYLGNKFSNPNLLINPDFKINQRGATSYEDQGYSVDRWKIWKVTVTPSTNGGITIKSDKYTETGNVLQYFENATEGDITLSCYVTSVSGTVIMVSSEDSQVTDNNPKVVLKQGLNVLHTSKNTGAFIIFLNQGASVALKWVKLEQGTVATSFIAPNSAEELIKCKQFYNRIYFFHVFYSATSNFDYSFSHVVQSMRTKPTATLSQSSSSGLSKYSASVNNSSGLTVITTATTNKVGNCNTGGIVELDAEIY